MVRSRRWRQSPGRLPAGLTGYRYLLAILVLVVLATGPMVLAVAAGLTSLNTPPAPEAEPFHRPADAAGASPADHELGVMGDADPGPEPHDRGAAEYR